MYCYTTQEMGFFGSLEDMPIEEIIAQFETNFFGVVQVTQQALPVMREQNYDDAIVNVTSVGGRIGLPILSTYHDYEKLIYLSTMLVPETTRSYQERIFSDCYVNKTLSRICRTGCCFCSNKSLFYGINLNLYIFVSSFCIFNKNY